MGFMHMDDRIHVVGHTGRVGSAIVRRLRANGHANLVTRTLPRDDFARPALVDAFYALERPVHVFIAPSREAPTGLGASQPAADLHEGLLMATNLIHAAWRAGVRRLLFLGTPGVDAGHAGLPLALAGLRLAPTDDDARCQGVGLAVAATLCSAYNRQYGTGFLAALPALVYGPGDDTDPARAWGVAALIHKAHCAVVARDLELRVSGELLTQGEFIYSDDLAAACVHLMDHCATEDVGDCVCIGSGESRSIEDAVRSVARVIGFKGEVVVDRSPETQVRHKVLDSSMMRARGWRPLVGFERGIELAYHDYLNRHVVGALL